MERTKLALAMEYVRLDRAFIGMVDKRVKIVDLEEFVESVAYCSKYWTKRMLFDMVTYLEQRLSVLLSDGEISEEYYQELMQANRYDYDVVRKMIAKM